MNLYQYVTIFVMMFMVNGFFYVASDYDDLSGDYTQKITDFSNAMNDSIPPNSAFSDYNVAGNSMKTSNILWLFFKGGLKAFIPISTLHPDTPQLIFYLAMVWQIIIVLYSVYGAFLVYQVFVNKRSGD